LYIATDALDAGKRVAYCGSFDGTRAGLLARWSVLRETDHGARNVYLVAKAGGSGKKPFFPTLFPQSVFRAAIKRGN
jgi:hypothetical protein